MSWITGRKDIFSKIATALGNLEIKRKTVWMHCASLGEFEQGRPLVELIRLHYPGYIIIITFFSPSGYEIRKNYKEADHVFYLPLDGKENARQFINLIRPDLVLWIKYDFWHYYLAELKNRHIPTFLISGAFREDQQFFRPFGAFWKNMLKCFNFIFLQNNTSAQLLSNIGFKENVMVAGDTRFDRVIDNARNFEPINFIEGYINHQQVIVAGSTWEEDEAVFVHYIKSHPDRKFIIAPHEIDKDNIASIKKIFRNAIQYSELQSLNQNSGNELLRASNVLIIDCIGLLSRLYYYADVAYVGGGFGENGLHNILEAAVFAKPVIFGPELDKNFEATEMIDAGGAVSIRNAIDLEIVMNELLNNDIELKIKGAAAKQYVYSRSGASLKVIDHLKETNMI